MIERKRGASTVGWRLALTTVFVFAILSAAANVIGCECAPPPPPCQAYWQTPLVFLGTVTDALATGDDRIVRARMRVDRAYKGVSEETLIVFDDGMCDGPDLQVGEQYLMYTHRIGEGDIPSRGCTRSRHVDYAEEDLKYLDGLGDATPTAAIFGQVVVRTDDYYGNDQPLPGVLIELSGTTDTHATTTDSDGHYSFENLRPAKYGVAASFPGFRVLSFSEDSLSTNVEPRGCAVMNVIMRRTWRGSIEGQILRSNGDPAPAGINLTLGQLQNGEGKQESNFLLDGNVTTNDRGEYFFSEVAPGRYKIVMNLYRFPSEKIPYPTFYWPGSRNESDALAVEVADAANPLRCDFRLPTEPKTARVAGIVLGSDGKPVAGARVYIDALPDNGIADDDGNRPTTDADGGFSFIAVDGVEYNLRARLYGPHLLHSAVVRFSLGKASQSITLLLDRFDGAPY